MLRARLLVLTTFLLAAGCAAPMPNAPAPGAQPRPAGVSDIALPGPAQGTEPSVALAPDGSAAYVVAPTFTDRSGENKLWRSEDGGKSWSYVGPVPSGGVGTNDADVTVRPDGSVWVAAMWVTGPQGATDPAVYAFSTKCTAVSMSKDKGKTWSADPLACGASPLYDERPWLASDASTTFLLRYQWARAPLVAGFTFGAVPPALSFTTDNAAWTDRPLARVAPGFFSRLVATKDAIAFANFPTTDGAFVGPVIETSGDQGLTWSETPVAKERADTRQPGFAIAADGKAIATWIPVTDHGAKVRASLRDASGKWGAPFTIEGNGTNVMTWADGNGAHLAVAWLHTDAAAHPCSVDAGAEWRVRVWLDGNVTEAPTVIHRGPVFNAFSRDCEKYRNLGDFMTAAVTKDGVVLVATAVDTDAGIKYGTAPIHVLRFGEPPLTRP